MAPTATTKRDLLEKDMSIGQRIGWSYGDDTAEYAVVSMTPLI